MKTVSSILLSIAVAFVVVPTIPAQASDFLPPGLTEEELQRILEEQSRDFDGDGVNDYDDDCPKTPGTSSYRYRGCPDSDGDRVSDQIDICPNDTDHNSCLSNHGLWAYPPLGDIWTCKELADWSDLIRNATYILWGVVSATAVGTALRIAVTAAGRVGLALTGSAAGGGILRSTSAKANVDMVYNNVCRLQMNV